MTNESNTPTELEQKSQQSASPTYALLSENKLEYGKILEQIPITETPFHVVITENGNFITLGNARITDMEDKETLINKIINKDWDLITSLVVMVTQNVVKGMEDEKKVRTTIPGTGLTINDKELKEAVTGP